MEPKLGSSELSLRSVKGSSKFAINLVGLAEKKEPNRSRDHNDRDTSNKAGQKIGEGRRHRGVRTECVERGLIRCDLRDQGQVSTMTAPLLRAL